MAYERFSMRDESYGVHLMNYRAPPVVSERHTIIEDCHGMQFHYTSAMAPQKVIFNPAAHCVHATKQEYQGSSWAKMPTNYAGTGPSLPPRDFYPQVGNQAPQLTRKPLTSDEAAKLYGGYVITEFRPRKQYHRA